MSWRSIACFAAALQAFCAAGGAAAQGQPPDAKSIRVVVPAPPGGNLDAGARLMAQRLSRLTGEAYFVDNRPGANTQIGTEFVVRAPADGRTLLFTGTGLVFLPLLQKVGFSPLEDLAPVAQFSWEHYVVVTPAGGQVGNAGELARVAAAKPGGVNCAAYPGVSTVACEQLRLRLGGRLTTVPFAGVAPALAAILGGHADLLFVNVEPVSRLIQSGKLRVLAQTAGAAATTRLQVPAIGDVWPDFLLEGHSGVYVPAGTPAARIEQLNRDVTRVLADPEVQALLRDSGQEPAGGTSQRFAEMLGRTQQRYGDLIRSLGLLPR